MMSRNASYDRQRYSLRDSLLIEDVKCLLRNCQCTETLWKYYELLTLPSFANYLSILNFSSIYK